MSHVSSMLRLSEDPLVRTQIRLAIITVLSVALLSSILTQLRKRAVFSERQNIIVDFNLSGRLILSFLCHLSAAERKLALLISDSHSSK